jgi:DNA-binding response OmpR family regulator
VDDEEYITSGIQNLLADDYTVLVAESGYKAFEMIKAKSPKIDLVLLDIGMPKKTGNQWVSEFRDEDPSLVVVMLTAFREDIDLIVYTLRAGASDYLMKPATSRILREKLKKMLNQKLLRDCYSQWMGTKHYRIKGSSTATVQHKFER